MEGTNIELFGSDIEVAWKGFDKTKPGVTVWRVKNFRLQLFESDGLFHVGDSYIIVNTTQSGKNELNYNIHFWLGSETSQDESGTAAYKAVELDTWLGGRATQYRELQGSESDTFLSYFKGGLRYAAGGNDSGFHHVVKLDYPTLLYWIHDNTVKQIPLVIDGITEDDLFVLDCGEKILIYRGQNATNKEALLAEYEALDIKSQRPKAIITHVETEELKREFLQIVGRGNSDKLENKLLRISEDGSAITESVDHKLSSDDTYLYKVGNTTWIWVGSKSSYAEANKAWQIAIKLTKPTDRLQLTREGYEPEAFWLLY